MNGPEGDTRQCTKEKGQQMKEGPEGRAGTPAKDWGSQDVRASNPGLEHPGQETATMQQGPLDWNIRGSEILDWNIRG